MCKTRIQDSDLSASRKSFRKWLDELQREMEPLTDDLLVKRLSELKYLDPAKVRSELAEFASCSRSEDIDRLRETAKQVFIAMSQVLEDKNICSIFGRVADYERNLFSLFPFYRDHVVHSIRVFLTGLYLLKVINEKLPSLYERCFKSDEIDFPTFLKWLLASTYHDIATPIEKFEEMNQALMDFYGQFPEFTFERARLRPLQSWIVSLPDFFSAIAPDPKIQANLLRGLDRNEHGILGAVTLLYLSVRGMIDLPEVPSDYYELYIQGYVVPAARGIAMHNAKGSTVTFEESPLSFLLILCDEIQEWGRIVSTGRGLIPHKSIYETWLDVKEVDNKLRINVLHLSNGRDHIALKRLNPAYDPMRVIEGKRQNLSRLRSDIIGGRFFVVRTAARSRDVDSDLKKNFRTNITYGNMYCTT